MEHIQTRNLLNIINELKGEKTTHLNRAASELNRALDVLDNNEFIHKESWSDVGDIIKHTDKKVASFSKDIVKGLKKEFNVEINEDIIKCGIVNKIMMEVSLQKKEWN